MWQLAVFDTLAVMSFLLYGRPAGIGHGPPNLTILAATAVSITAFFAFRQYRPRIALSALDTVPSMIVCVWLIAPLGMLGIWTIDASLLREVAATATLIGALILIRIVYFSYLRRRRTSRPQLGARTLVIGGGKVASELVHSMLDHPKFGLKPVLVMDDDPLDPQVFPTEVIPWRHRLADLIVEHRIDTVIVAFSQNRDSTLVEPLRDCDTLDTEIYVVPRLYEFVHQNPDMDRIHTIPLVLVRRLALRSSHWRIKRVYSLLTATVALALLSPLLLAVAAAIKLREPSAAMLFRQTRVGQDGKLFTLYKFRTMSMAAGSAADVDWSPDRVTRLGGFLRKYSIDELPQLWNVIRGDMSMVGPRPERPHFVDQFGAAIPTYQSRHRVHAGLTGWAAINGLRGDTDIRDRASYDNFYIENWSLWLDTKILLLTVGSVLLGRGR